MPDKVPPTGKRSTSAKKTKKTATKKLVAKKSATKRAAVAKTATRKTATKKTATRKTATKKAATRRAKEAATIPTRVQVRQVRSGIGHAQTYRRTLRALGLKHHQDVVLLPNTPSVRGMLHKVRHFVRVTPEEA